MGIHLRHFLLILALAAPVAAGCADDDSYNARSGDGVAAQDDAGDGTGSDGQQEIDETYSEQLTLIDENLNGVMARIFSSDTLQEDQLREGLKALREAEGILAETDPPEEVAGIHEDYLQGIRDYQEVMNDLLAVGNDRDALARYMTTGQLDDVNIALQDVARRYGEAGYN